MKNYRKKRLQWTRVVQVVLAILSTVRLFLKYLI